MREIEKPEIKITGPFEDEYEKGHNDGYNNACEDWQAYHNQEMQKKDTEIAELKKLLKGE